MIAQKAAATREKTSRAAEREKSSSRRAPAPAPFNPTHYRLVTTPVPVPTVQRKCAACDDEAGGGLTLTAPRLQARSLFPGVRVGPADHPLEREADRAAERVMRSPEPSPAANRPCEACAGAAPQIQRAPAPAAVSAAPAAPAPPAVPALDGRGQPLSPSLRARFEPGFGRSFSAVRVHDGPAAADMAGGLLARAFTFGPHIVFGHGQYRPHETSGQELLAHELAHVVQQGAAPPASRDRAPGDAAGDPPPLTSSGVAPHLARTPLDFNAIRSGILAAVAPTTGTPPALPAAQSGEVAGAFAAASPTAPAPRGGHPPPDPAPVPTDSTLPLQAHFFPAARTTLRTALIVGGFHGDEHPGFQMAEDAVTQLSTPGSPMATSLAFHTVIIPRVNVGAVHDHLAGVTSYDRRCNRQLVDLNRNFPTGGTPRATDCPNTATAPVQPEVQGVMDVVTQFQPDRILSGHAISSSSRAGVFADPNTDPASVDLACSMAGTLDPSNTSANALTPTTCNPIYPGDTRGSVGGGTTFGAWAPTAIPGRTTPTITSEAPTYSPLAATGARSIEAYRRVVQTFLTAPEQEDSDIQRDIQAFSATDQVLFLTGRLAVANAIYDRIRARIQSKVRALNGLGPPVQITIESQQRAFDVPVGSASAQAQIVFDKFFMTGSRARGWDTLDSRFYVGGSRSRGVDRTAWLALPSLDRLTEILRFSSLPGTSRHHWGTDVDFNSTTASHWDPLARRGRGGRLVPLFTWLQANAPAVGFMQAYTARPAPGTSGGRTGGYDPEPWHWSYAPLAFPLRSMYNAQVNIPTDVVDAIVSDFTTRGGTANPLPADFRTALSSLPISDFVNQVGPGL